MSRLPSSETTLLKSLPERRLEAGANLLACHVCVVYYMVDDLVSEVRILSKNLQDNNAASAGACSFVFAYISHHVTVILHLAKDLFRFA